MDTRHLDDLTPGQRFTTPGLSCLQRFALFEADEIAFAGR